MNACFEAPLKGLNTELEGKKLYEWGDIFFNLSYKGLVNRKKMNFYQVPLSLCTDNAAMIGWNALELAKTMSLKKNNYSIRPTPNILINKSYCFIT